MNIDSRDGLGYIVSWWYIFIPPTGTLLLRRLQQVADVLCQAGIEVYSTTFSDDGWLVCEPHPDRIHGALSGKLAEPTLEKVYH